MRKRLIPGLFLVCMVIIMLWTILAGMQRRPFQGFTITSADFQHFAPTSTVGLIRTIWLDPDEPGAINIMATQLRGEDRTRHVVRLAHGYNMPMCMKIKGYTVEEIMGKWQEGKWEGARGKGREGMGEGERGKRQGGSGKGQEARGQAPDSNGSPSPLPLSTSPLPPNPRIQIWRLTSPTGSQAIWVTRILHAADLADTGLDVTSLTFPRVGIPDDPRWNPQGIDRDTLRHPWRWIRRSVRSAWNSARCDPAVFLRLKQPAWASDELLTLVASSELLPTPGDTDAIIRRLLFEQSDILRQAKEYRAGSGEG